MVAIPVVAAVLIALMALLLMYGLKEFGKAIANIFPSSIGVSVASIHPRAWVEAGVDALEAGISWVLGDVIRPMINLVLGPVVAVIQFAEALDYAVSHAAGAFAWLIDTKLPDLAYQAWHSTVDYYHRAVAYAAGVEARASAGIIRWYHYAVAYTATAIRAVEATVAADYRKAIGYAEGVEARASAGIIRWYHYAVAHTDQAVKAAEATMAGEIAKYAGVAAADLKQALAYTDSQAAAAVKTAEGYAATTATTAVGVLVTDVDNAIAPAAAGLIEDVGSLVGVIGSDFPDVGALLRDLDLTKLGELAGGLAGALTIARALTRLAEDCTVPNCRNLSGVGRALQDLFALVEGGAFLALVAALISDPHGTADELHQLLDPIVSDGIDAARSTLGV